MRKFLEEIGPLLAGFQIAGSIIGFFGIGAVAKWILEHWLPFTRWAWGEIFAFINLPDITTQEKDALTTLAFFAPMAISSFISWWTRNDPSRQGPWGEVPENQSAKEIRLRLYAALIGATFMVVVGGSVIQDAITLFTTAAAPKPSTGTEEPVLNIETFARFGLLVAILAAVGLVSFILYWLSRQFEASRVRTDNFVQWLGSNTKPIKHMVSSAAVSMAASVISSIATLVSFAATFGGIALAATQLGPIRTVAPMFVLISLLATIFLNPARLLKTAGVVIALIVASFGWDLAVSIVRAVENAPT